MKKLFFFAVIVVLSAACGTKKQAAVNSSPSAAEMIGGQRDAHGCLTAAGYTWSLVRNDCIRTWEEGVRMSPKSKFVDSTLAAYVVFAADSSRAEIFMPDRTLVLNRLEKGLTWLGSPAEGMILSVKPGGLELFDSGRSATWTEAE